MGSSGHLVGVHCSATKGLDLWKECSSRAALGFETLLMILDLLAVDKSKQTDSTTATCLGLDLVNL